jgi:hypothetical protein
MATARRARVHLYPRPVQLTDAGEALTRFTRATSIVLQLQDRKREHDRNTETQESESAEGNGRP